MALDGALLSQLAHEIRIQADGARIDRVAQPYRDEIILHLRWRGGAGKLLLSASASDPRLHFTDNIPENPQNPPMFCMLLRKHLTGARLQNIRQEGMDRILYLDFESLNELGDPITLTLVQEIMGAHSNLILVNHDGLVLDAIKRVGLDMSSVRQVLPNLRYHLPPAQEKLNILTTPIPEIIVEIQAKKGAISRGIMDTIQGMSPMPSREIAFRALGADDIAAEQLSATQWSQLANELQALYQLLTEYKGTPTMLLELEGRPKDFTFFAVEQFGNQRICEEYPSYGELLDSFYAKRNTLERMRQLSHGLHKSVQNIHDRIARRVAVQQEEVLATKKRDEYRIAGDILTANIYALQKGINEVTLQNYYSEDATEITISLDSMLSPAENAQAYYAKYRKANTAEKILSKQIYLGKSELEYIDTVLDSLHRATTASDLAVIRQELVTGGYLRKQNRKKTAKTPKQIPHTYLSSDGFTILAGRNNLQNDQLSLKEGQKHDLWFHTQNIPGSHTIIITERKEVPQTTLEEAAVIAAYHSKAQDSTNVPVDYTQVRHVHKQSGAKPGMVTYNNFQTLFVTPDEALLSKLEK